MRRSGEVMLVLWLAGCGSATSGAGFVGDGGPETLRITGGDGQLMTTEVGRGGSIFQSPVPAPPGRVYAALPAAFEALELEVNRGDRRDRVLGVENVRLRRIAGDRPSRFLECGMGVTRANADAYDIYLTFLARVSPGAGEGSEVQVLPDAVARNPAHGGSAVGCGSTGRLEERLIEELESALGAEPPRSRG